MWTCFGCCCGASRVHPGEDDSLPTIDSDQPQEGQLNRSNERQGSAGSLSSELKQSMETIGKVSISDVEKKEEIDSLTVKQLRVILATNLVDYKGCQEQDELITRVKMLWESRQANKQLYERLLNPELTGAPGYTEEPELCKICMDAPIDCVFLECGHMVTCTKCGKQMPECPICRQYVARAVHIFRA